MTSFLHTLSCPYFRCSPMIRSFRGRKEWKKDKQNCLEKKYLLLSLLFKWNHFLRGAVNIEYGKNENGDIKTTGTSQNEKNGDSFSMFNLMLTFLMLKWFQCDRHRLSRISWCDELSHQKCHSPSVALFNRYNQLIWNVTEDYKSALYLWHFKCSSHLHDCYNNIIRNWTCLRLF